MCFIINKWQKFEPTKEYLDVVKELTTVTKLHKYTLDYSYIAEKRDYWKVPTEFIKDGGGDCLEGNTDILTENGIKKIKDINIGDLVLSYNYTLKKYEYKKVTNKWDKGILEGNIVKLRNGHKIIATDGHRFFCRAREDKERYEIKKLKDINLNYWLKRHIHCVSSLPEGEIDIGKDLAYIMGIYLAEGYSEKHRICIAQDKEDIRDKIEQALNSLNVPYSKSKRTTNAFYTILKSGIKNDLKKLGLNSFDKKLPLEVLNWDKESLTKLIEGMLDGDGTDRNKKWNPDNSLWEFSTSSEQVAKIFNIICRKVYGNCWFYKQENHQGVGTKPIYRLRYNPEGLSNKEIFNGISLVSVKSLEKVSGKHYYDIEVEGNHNFVLADSGVISHNCEDFARFTTDVLVRIQKRKNVRFVCYFGYNGKVKTGHAVTVFPYKEKYSVFSNRSLLHQYDNYIDIGHEFYPDGLKRIEIRDWQGNVLETKRKWFGIF